MAALLGARNMLPFWFRVLPLVVPVVACSAPATNQRGGEPQVDPHSQVIATAPRGATSVASASDPAQPIDAAVTPRASATPSPAASPVEAASPTEAVPASERPALDIEYVPTPPNVVRKMLEVAEIRRDDVVYDLGCGDGRLVIAAASRYGVRAVGFDLDPDRVSEARANVEKAKVGHLVSIEQKNIFDVDLSGATVVTLYLLPSINVRLLPQLAKLRDGSRVVSHDFDIAGVSYDRVWTIRAKHHRPPPEQRDHYVYRWIAPITPP